MSEQKIQYTNPHEMLISLIKSYYNTYPAKTDKHYSFDANNRVFIGYDRNIKPSIHLTWKEANRIDDSNITIEDINFEKWILKVEICVEKDCEDIETQYLIAYRNYISQYGSEKKAWAIGFKECEKLTKVNQDYIFTPVISRAKKSKWNQLVILAFPKNELKKFDDYIWLKLGVKHEETKSRIIELVKTLKELLNELKGKQLTESEIMSLLQLKKVFDEVVESLKQHTKFESKVEML